MNIASGPLNTTPKYYTFNQENISNVYQTKHVNLKLLSLTFGYSECSKFLRRFYEYVKHEYLLKKI